MCSFKQSWLACDWRRNLTLRNCHDTKVTFLRGKKNHNSSVVKIHLDALKAKEISCLSSLFPSNWYIIFLKKKKNPVSSKWSTSAVIKWAPTSEVN